MTFTQEAPLSQLSSRDGRRLLRNLLGGSLIVLVWFALWAWMAAGVVRPLSTVPRLSGERAALVDT